MHSNYKINFQKKFTIHLRIITEQLNLEIFYWFYYIQFFFKKIKAQYNINCNITIRWVVLTINLKETGLGKSQLKPSDDFTFLLEIINQK